MHMYGKMGRGKEGRNSTEWWSWAGFQIYNGISGWKKWLYEAATVRTRRVAGIFYRDGVCLQPDSKLIWEWP